MADVPPAVDPPVDAGEPEEPDDPALDEPTPQPDGSPDAPDPPYDPADEAPPPEAPDDDEAPPPEVAPEPPAAVLEPAPEVIPAPPPPPPPAPEPAPEPTSTVPPQPVPEPEPVLVPIQRTYTTPSGQAVTVIDHPDVKPVEEVKPAPVVEQAPAQPLVVEQPAAPVTVTEPAKIVQQDPPPKAVEVLTPTIVATVADRIVAAHNAINDPKPAPVGVSAKLDRQIGIFHQYIAGADRTLSLQQHVYSISGDDFTVFGDGNQKILRTWGKTLSASGKMHMIDYVSGAAITNLRKKPLRLLSSWYTDALGHNKVEIKSVLSMGTRTLKIHFLNFQDNQPVDLYLKGHFGETKGALLHLGKDAKGPVVARIDRDVMNTRQILHGKQTYHLHVMKNFDYALASLICIAFEDRSCFASTASAIVMKR